MNARGQRGEALTIALVAIIGTLVVASAIPSINVFGKIFGGGSSSVKAPAEEAWKEQEQRTIPRTVGVTETGEKVIAFEQVRTFRSGASKHPPKLSYGERIGEFFAGLTTFGVILCLALFLLFGITPAMIVNWLKSRRLQRVEEDRRRKDQALTNTVAALRGVDPETWVKIAPLLAARQDKQDKEQIDLIKAKLH